MIRINMDELDRLIDVFQNLSSDADNTMGKTTMLRNEMLNDPELMALANSEDIISILDQSIDSLIILNEDILSLKSVLIAAKDDFEANEKIIIKAINEIKNKLDSIQSELDATMNSNQIVVIDRSEQLSPVNEVEQLVAGSATALELTNIAALSQLATSEIEAREIRDRQ